jgi:hypothetical protein
MEKERNYNNTCKKYVKKKSREEVQIIEDKRKMCKKKKTFATQSSSNAESAPKFLSNGADELNNFDELDYALKMIDDSNKLTKIKEDADNNNEKQTPPPCNL